MRVLGPNYGYPWSAPLWALASEDLAVFMLVRLFSGTCTVCQLLQPNSSTTWQPSNTLSIFLLLSLKPNKNRYFVKKAQN